MRIIDGVPSHGFPCDSWRPVHWHLMETTETVWIQRWLIWSKLLLVRNQCNEISTHASRNCVGHDDGCGERHTPWLCDTFICPLNCITCDKVTSAWLGDCKYIIGALNYKSGPTRQLKLRCIVGLVGTSASGHRHSNQWFNSDHIIFFRVSWEIKCWDKIQEWLFHLMSASFLFMRLINVNEKDKKQQQKQKKCTKVTSGCSLTCICYTHMPAITKIGGPADSSRLGHRLVWQWYPAHGPMGMWYWMKYSWSTGYF